MLGEPNRLVICGEVIKSLRLRRGLSLEVVAGQLGHTSSWLWKIENDQFPLDKIADAIALSRVLNVPLATLCSETDIRPEEVAPLSPVSANNGLDVPWTASGSLSALRTITEGHDVDRRDFLAVSGSALISPVAGWLDGDAPDNVGMEQLASSNRVTDPAVDTLVGITSHLRRLDEHLSRDVAFATIRSHLRGAQALLRDHSYTDSVGRRLYGVVAELLRLCGRLTYEDGQRGAAQRYLSVALRTAHTAGDFAQGANILAYMADLEYDAHNMGDSLRLAELAQQGYRGDTPEVAARVDIQAALAQAALRDERGCAQSLDSAFARIAEANPSEAPGWVHWVDAAMCHQFAGGCNFMLGRWTEAKSHYQQATNIPSSWANSSPTELGRIKVRLATIHLRQEHPDIDQAVAIGGEALDLFSSTGATPSVAIGKNVTELTNELTRYRRRSEVREFVDRIRSYAA